jgi:hypothetical protein
MTDETDIASDVMAFVRGETDTDALRRAGIEVAISDSGLRLWEPPGMPVVTPSREDIASGLLANYALGTTLREWAAVMLAANLIDFVELEAIDDDPLLEALWAAAAGDETPEDALDVARGLVEG